MDTKRIRHALITYFNDEEFKAFCFDHYHPVYQQFTTGMTLGNMVQLLLDYCARRNLLPNLVAQISEEKPRLETELLKIRETTSNIESYPDEETKEVNPKKYGLFRGINLGHNIDPLRSALKVMEADLFEEVCKAILRDFKFEIANREPLAKSILSDKTKIGRGIVFKGVFFDTFTYAQQLFTEFGHGIDKRVSKLLGKETYFNDGGIVEQMHGPACVIIHSQAKATPDEKDVIAFGESIKSDSINNIICFSNQRVLDSRFFGIMNSRLYDIGLTAAVLCVEDLAYQVLITNVYHKYKSQLEWSYRTYLS